MQSLITALMLLKAASTAVPVPQGVPLATPSPGAGTSAEKPISAPMTKEAWDDMNAIEKRQYADATVQGLRRNGFLAQCQGLTPEAIVTSLDRKEWEGNLLIIGVATAAYGICL